MLKLGKYLAIAKINLNQAIVYRSNVLGGLLFYALFIFVFFSLWRAIYHGGEVQGYSLRQVVWYLCITELLVFGCRTPVFTQMNEDIKTGALAYQLIRPCHYVGYQFAGAVGRMVFNLVCFGILAVVLGMVMVGPLPDYALTTLPLGILSACLGLIINFFLLMCLGLTAFRLEENSAFYLSTRSWYSCWACSFRWNFCPAGCSGSPAGCPSLCGLGAGTAPGRFLLAAVLADPAAAGVLGDDCHRAFPAFVSPGHARVASQWRLTSDGLKRGILWARGISFTASSP